MPDREIRVKTSADLSGVNALYKQLEAIRDLAREISKTGIQFGPGGPTISPKAQETQQRMMEARQQAMDAMPARQGIRRIWQAAKKPAQQAAGQTPMGQKAMTGAELGEWFEENWPQAAPMVTAVMRETMGGITPNQAQAIVNNRVKYAPKPGTVEIPKDVAKKYKWEPMGEPGRAQTWFLAAGHTAMSPEMRAEYEAVNEAWALSKPGHEKLIEDFYRKYAAEANMVPVAQPAKPAPTTWDRFKQGLRGRGGGAGDSWTMEGIAGAVGGLLGKILPIGGPLALGMAAVGLGVSSFNQYMQSGEALSGLVKQIISAGDSLEKLQTQAHEAGAALGYMPQQVDRIMNIIGTAYGHIGTQGLINTTNQVLGYARAYGLPVETTAAAFAQAAQMGIVSGAGASVNTGQFMAMLANSAAQSNMAARMPELISETLSVLQQIQKSAIVAPNIQGLMDMITQMNVGANGVRQLQGQGGANLINQFAQGMQQPGLGGPGMAVEYQALGLNNYWDFLHSLQMGPTYKLPYGPHAGQMQMQAIIQEWEKIFGFNKNNLPKFGGPETGYMGLTPAAKSLEGLFAYNYFGGNMPQAGAFLKIFGGGINPSQGLIESLLKPYGGLSALQNDPQAWSKIGILSQIATAKSGKDIQSIIEQIKKYGGELTPGEQKILESSTAPMSEKQRILTQEVMRPGFAPLTKSEQIQTLNAKIDNAQITIGQHIAGAATGLTHPQSSPTAKAIEKTNPLGANWRRLGEEIGSVWKRLFGGKTVGYFGQGPSVSLAGYNTPFLTPMQATYASYTPLWGGTQGLNVTAAGYMMDPNTMAAMYGMQGGYYAGPMVPVRWNGQQFVVTDSNFEDIAPQRNSGGKGYGAKLSNQTLRSLYSQLIQAGIPKNDARTLIEIAGAESGYDPTSIGDQGTSVGLWQIHEPAWKSYLQQVTGSSDPNKWTKWLEDPENNLEAAIHVYKTQGLSAWTTYNNGDYRQFEGVFNNFISAVRDLTDTISNATRKVKQAQNTPGVTHPLTGVTREVPV